MYFIKTHTLIPMNYITVMSVCCGMSINVCRTLESLESVIEQIWNLFDADSSEEAEQLREAVLSGRVRLQQAELEAEQWKEELRRLQTHNCEQSQQIQQLRQDRQNSQEHNNRSETPYEEQLHVKKVVSYERLAISDCCDWNPCVRCAHVWKAVTGDVFSLQHEVSLLQQQLAESRQLLHSLQSELRLYDRVCGARKSAAAGETPQEHRNIFQPCRAANGEKLCLLAENLALCALSLQGLCVSRARRWSWGSCWWRFGL